MTLKTDQWQTVVNVAGESPSVGEVAAELVDREAAENYDTAEQLVEDAIESGTLLETDEGMFGSVEVTETDTDDTRAETTPADPRDATPTHDTTPAVRPVSWAGAEFASPESGIWVAEQRHREQWMGHKHGDKQPFAPWADSDAGVECGKHDEERLCSECGHDARFKWGYEPNYTDHAEAREWATKHPRLAGLAYLQSDDDPLAFVDGDDVRCPETGEVHPAFKAVLEQLGTTYADVSVSGSGVHAVYRGELPEGCAEATWEIDSEPWGKNDADDLPVIEIYDGKHVCIATGEHIPGTPRQAHEWDSGVLETILEAAGELSGSVGADSYNSFDSDNYEPTATSSSETTDKIEDVYAALDRLDAQRVAEKTIVDEWLEPPHREHRAFAPTWAPSGYDGTANFVNSEVWKDSGTRGGKGGPACMAAIDAGLVTDKDCPDRVEGKIWRQAVDHLRDLGYDIPRHEKNADPIDRLEKTGDEETDELREWVGKLLG